VANPSFFKLINIQNQGIRSVFSDLFIQTFWFLYVFVAIFVAEQPRIHDDFPAFFWALRLLHGPGELQAWGQGLMLLAQLSSPAAGEWLVNGINQQSKL